MRSEFDWNWYAWHFLQCFISLVKRDVYIVEKRREKKNKKNSGLHRPPHEREKLYLGPRQRAIELNCF